MVEINENRLNGGKDKNQFSLKRDLSLIRTEPLELEYMYSICKNNNVVFQFAK